MKKLFLASLIVTVPFVGGCSKDENFFNAPGAFSLEASKVQPRTLSGDSIPIEKVPMFICLGFDDNGIAEKTKNGGATWILNYLNSKSNPSGANNPLAFDGSPFHASFYMT